jgi:hypothetical protein
VLECGVVVFEGFARGGNLFGGSLSTSMLVVPAEVSSWLDGVGLVRPPVAGGRSVLVLGPAGLGVRGGGLGILRFVGCFSGEVLVGS